MWDCRNSMRFLIKWACRRLLPWMMLICGLFCISAVAKTDPDAQKRVLVLYATRKDAPSANAFERVFQKTLSDGLGGRLDYYAEYIDVARFPDPEYQAALRDFFRRKYEPQRFDLVLASTNSGFEFVTRYGAELFPGVPVVFSGGLNMRRIPNSTGLVYPIDIKSTLDLALRLQPNTKHVFVVSGASEFDKYYENIARLQFQDYESRVAFTYLMGRSLKDLREMVATLPKNSIIYFLTMAEDTMGNKFIPLDALNKIFAAANAPIYSWNELVMDHGIIGGSLLSTEVLAQQTAELALRVLQGENPDQIPVIETKPNINMFDWRQLQRWGISERQLPAGSVVRFREPSFWDVFRWRIIGVITLCVAEAILIFALLLQRARRKQMQAGLRESEELHRVTISNISDAVFITDDYGVFTYICSNVNVIFGYSPKETRDLGTIAQLLGGNLFDPDELDAAGEIRNIEQEVTDRTGLRRTLLTHVKRVSVQQGTTLYVCRDITERKQAENKLKESEKQLRLLTETIPQLVWTSQPDGSTDYCNQRWLDYTGLTMEEATGRGWQSALHPADSERALGTRHQAMSAGQGYEQEVRLRSASGAYRWFLSRSLPMRDSAGRIVKWYGTNTDIEDRKQVEEALRNSEEELRKSHTRIEDLAGRLIIAQEEERKHLARELHDDLNQELVALAIGISRLKRQYPDAGANIQEQAAHLQDKTKWLSERVRQMSHQLHSSILQHVGLVAALRSYCAEFTEREGITVSLHIRDDLEAPENIALCLYRVTQESLRNTARHSGAKSATVTLALVGNLLELRVADQGAGFDPDQAKERRGLGLISMEERVRLLRGSFELKSQPGVGTELRVRISLNGKPEKK